MKRTVALLLSVLTVLMLLPAFSLAATKVPEKIEVDSSSTLAKDTYAVGESFKAKGLKFIVTYDDASTETIGYSATGLKFRTVAFTPTDGAAGTVAIDYTYTKNGVTVANNDITVNVDILDSLVITYDAGVMNYKVGQKFNRNLMVVTAKYKNGSIADKIVKDYKVSKEAFTEDDVPSTTVTVSYTEGGVTVYNTVDVNVTMIVPTSLDIIKYPKKMNYAIGDKLNITGMVAVVTYSDSSQKTVTPVYDKDYQFTEDDAQKGSKDIDFSYTEAGITVTDTVQVNIAALSSLDVTKNPKKMTYFSGESFDPTGMEVTATYTNGKTAVINNYSHNQVKPFSKADFMGGDTKDITIFYTENGFTASTTLEVTLAQPKTLSVEADPDKTVYKIGEVFDPTGMIVKVTYSNGAEYETSSYSFSAKPFEKGDTKITLFYSDGDLDPISVDVAVTVEDTFAVSVHIDKGSLNLTAGDKAPLLLTIYPRDYDYDSTTIKWDIVSGATNVADVDQNGVVYAVGAGNCVVRATVTSNSENYYAYCYVCVVPKIGLNSLKFSSGSMELLLGDMTTLGLVKSPANATVANLTWKSSDPSIVSVNDKGQIKGLKPGEATISATCDGKVATIKITVVSSLSRYGTVYNCSNRVQVHVKADGASKVPGYAPYGCTYKIVGESGNWYQIIWGSQKVWIWKKYLRVSDTATKSYVVDSATNTEATAAETAETTATTATVATATKVTIVNCNRYVYIRKGPSTTYSKIGHATLGSTYALKGASGDWYVIDINGETGYIYKPFGQVS